MVQPRQFVSLQPAPSLPRAACLGIAPARLAEDYRQSRPHLRDRQRRRRCFLSARQMVRGNGQTGTAAAGKKGRSTPVLAHQLASAYKKLGWQTWVESLDFPRFFGSNPCDLTRGQANSTGTTLLSTQVCQPRKKL